MFRRPLFHLCMLSICLSRKACCVEQFFLIGLFSQHRLTTHSCLKSSLFTTISAFEPPCLHALKHRESYTHIFFVSMCTPSPCIPIQQMYQITHNTAYSAKYAHSHAYTYNTCTKIRAAPYLWSFFCLSMVCLCVSTTEVGSSKYINTENWQTSSN